MRAQASSTSLISFGVKTRGSAWCAETKATRVSPSEMQPSTSSWTSGRSSCVTKRNVAAWLKSGSGPLATLRMPGASASATTG